MRGLNYNHLYYFWVVAREGSIARAGELLHLTPQTISSQLRALEESLGGQLFSRAGRRLVLTEVGSIALHYAEEIFRLGSELGEVLEGQVDGLPLVFNVGIVDVVPKAIAYRLLEPALRISSPVQIICREGKLEALLADVAVHKLDMVLADSPMATTALVRAFNHLLGECGISFFATPKLAELYGTDFPNSLRAAPLLIPTVHTVLRGALMQWFDQLDLQPRIAGEFEDRAQMKAFGRAGVGVFTAPSVIEQEVMQQYQVVVIGRTNQVRERFYAISAERRLRHPAVVAVSKAARFDIFGGRRTEHPTPQAGE